MNPPEMYMNQYFPVLDHGFVSLVDWMGDDESIESAARVSYGAGTRSVRKTRGLIRYLMRHRHTTPFEMVELKFHCAMPLFVARQWIRHRTANVNEYSGRYSVMPEAFYVPEESRYGAQSKTNRQGTDQDARLDMPYKDFKYFIESASAESFREYKTYLGHDVARELARINLPLNMFTEWYWKVDLHNLFHFLGLRMDPHAQWEIRQYANIMAGLTATVAPLAFEAFLDYSLSSYRLSSAELSALRDICEGGRVNEDELKETMSNREIDEFKDAMFGEFSPPKLEDFALDPDDALTPEQARTRLHGERVQ